MLEPGEWFACDYPERMPVLGVTWFHTGCRPCWLAAKAMDLYWDRGKWPNLPELLEGGIAPSRQRLERDEDGVLHNHGIFDPPLIIELR